MCYLSLFFYVLYKESEKKSVKMVVEIFILSLSFMQNQNKIHFMLGYQLKHPKCLQTKESR